MVKTFYSVVIYNHHLKKVPVILVKLMRFNAILWFASTADRNNACARTGWPLATHYIQKHILFSCFRLHSKFVSHFFTFSRFIFAFYARCIETDIGKVINVQTNVVVICFVLLVCFLWGGFLSIFSMRFFVPFAINSFLQLIKALTLRFMIQGACIEESGRERERVRKLELDTNILTGLHQNFFPNCTKNSRLIGSKRSDGLKPRFFSMIQLLVLFERRRWKTGVWLKFRLANRDESFWEGVLSERCILNITPQCRDLNGFWTWIDLRVCSWGVKISPYKNYPMNLWCQVCVIKFRVFSFTFMSQKGRPTWVIRIQK